MHGPKNKKRKNNAGPAALANEARIPEKGRGVCSDMLTDRKSLALISRVAVARNAVEECFERRFTDVVGAQLGR